MRFARCGCCCLEPEPRPKAASRIFSVELCVTSVFYRGRNAHYCVPPAQIPASGIPAPGSHLGCLTAKRWFGQG